MMITPSWTRRSPRRWRTREGSGSTAQLNLTRFRVIDNDIGEARATGPVTIVRGQDGNIQLSGQINVDEARIEPEVPGSTGIVSMDVVEINRPGGDDQEAEVRRRGPQIGLDIALRSSGGKVRVSGRGLNVVLDVNARVRGTVAQPQLTGTANVVRGDYEFAGKRFVFDESGRVTLSTDPEDIRLNLSATREDAALTATINVTGTAAQPKIALTSTPALPQDEILSQVLFGRSAAQLSPFEAAQLAAGVAALAGGGGFDVIGNLRELAGLDRLSFGGQASALTVAGGRYITDDVYLEVIGGGEGGAAVKVEWQPRRNLAISSQFGGQGDDFRIIIAKLAFQPVVFLFDILGFAVERLEGQFDAPGRPLHAAVIVAGSDHGRTGGLRSHQFVKTGHRLFQAALDRTAQGFRQFVEVPGRRRLETGAQGGTIGGETLGDIIFEAKLQAWIFRRRRGFGGQ